MSKGQSVIAALLSVVIALLALIAVLLSSKEATAEPGDPVGAYCFGPACNDFPQSVCDAQSGMFMGEGTDCSDANSNEVADACEAFGGACCFGEPGDFGCVVTIRPVCFGLANGEFQGFGTNCVDIDYCMCPADFNGDGVVNVLDLVRVIEDWGECYNGGTP